MKILVLQLARLGDIYQSWPAIRALKRKHPHAQIDVLTRPRFAEALLGLNCVHQVKTLKNKEILEPLVQINPDVTLSFQRLSNEMELLKNENYDWIINFSYSPSSSYIVSILSKKETKVTGYTRHEDGFLKIPDDISAYFYAQVGVGKPNRFHISDIFATQVEADLTEEDWAPPELHDCDLNLPKNFVVIHVGTSESKKSLPPHKWSAIINRFRQINSSQVVLIGSNNEQRLAESIMSSIPENVALNLVGKTSLAQIFYILSKSLLLIGCDSAPMHMASLTKTPCLNLSFSSVNFWETGPRSPQSFIVKGNTEEDFVSDKISSIADKIINKQKVEIGVVVGQKGAPSYSALSTRQQDFEWEMIQAIYQGKAFPQTDDPIFFDGIEKLSDVNCLIIEQLQKISEGVAIENVAGIIDRGEEIIQTIARIVPSLGILIRWYQTEKIRIGPGETKEVLIKTLQIHNLLKQVLEIHSWRPYEQNQL